MNLTYYARILIRRGWILILAMVITAGAAYGLMVAVFQKGWGAGILLND